MFKYILGGCFLAISTFGFAEQHTWYFVRHFQKQLGDNPSLTETGTARAQALAAFFSDKPLNSIYSTDYLRTQQTASPAAKLKKLAIESYDPRDLAALACQLKTLDHVLVVGHSNTTPTILSLMGGASITIEESEYGMMYTVKKSALGIHFSRFHIPLK